MYSEKISYQHLHPGQLITYHLRPDQLPTNPLKEWHGKILYLYTYFQNIVVEVLDEGYKGEQDIVYIEQIIKVEEA